MGFVLSVALIFLLLVLDQKYAKPGQDFMSPIGMVFYAFIVIAVSAAIGAFVQPLRAASAEKRQVRGR